MSSNNAEWPKMWPAVAVESLQARKVEEQQKHWVAGHPKTERKDSW